MILNHTVEVAAPVARVWALLDDLESVIPCMPGATLLSRDGDSYEANIKVKVGVIAMDFVGTAKILDRNPSERRVTIQGAGKDRKGKGAASATVLAELTPLDAGRTSVSLQTDLALSGRIAQFGGSIINEIASRLIDQFVANLNDAMLADKAPAGEPAEAEAAAAAPAADGQAADRPEAPAAPAMAGRPPRPAPAEAAALDLGALMRPLITRYAIMALLLVIAFALGFVAGRAF